MSHHTIKTQCYAYVKPIVAVVHAGWDVPLQRFFMYIETDFDNYAFMSPTAELGGFIYDNLSDPNARHDLAYYVNKLLEYSIYVPHTFLDTIEKDKQGDCAQASVEWEDVAIGPMAPEELKEHYQHYLR